MAEWVGVDFDGTLCTLPGMQPVPDMVERIRQFRAQGVEVRICTARVNPKHGNDHNSYHTKLIQSWCEQYLGERLPVVACKDYDMVVLYDDRAIAVKTNTGECRGWYDTLEVGIAPDADAVE